MFGRQSTDVSNSDGHVHKWVHSGCNPFSHCMQRSPRLKEDVQIQNAACHYTEEVLLSVLPCPGLVPTPGPVPLMQLRRGASSPVLSSMCAQQARLWGWAVLLSTLLITLRGFLRCFMLSRALGQWGLLCPLPTLSPEISHGSPDALTWKLTFPDLRPAVYLSTCLPNSRKSM